MSTDNKQTNYFYYFYYCKTNVLTAVSHRLFKKVSNPVLQLGKSKVRLFDCNNRKATYNILKKFVAESDSFDIESLTEVKDTWAFLKLLMKWLPIMGKTASAIQNIRKFIFPLLQLVRSCYQITQNINVSSIISVLLDFLSLYECVGTAYNAESLDAVLLAGVSYLLPKQFADFLKRMTMFSNVKLADDVNLFYQFFNYLFDFIFDTLKKINAPICISKFFYDSLNFLKISNSHLLLYEMEAILQKWDLDKKIILKTGFLERFKFIQDKFIKDININEWARKSQTISNVVSMWDRLAKIVKNNEKINRVEPNCFIFEGPPGCKKSYLSNLICQALKEPVYAHMVKAVTDGKDWYDNYNNEPLFFMDDVGAQGISQWRTIINMVSCVKMPLDCAQAELKDTKYFNSTTILLTTNKFMSLVDVTKQDCISDVTALYRRGYVFDMSQVMGSGDWISGTIVFRHFDVKRTSWQEGFPRHINSQIFLNIPTKMVVTELTPRTKIVSWMVAIIKKFSIVKEQFATLGELSQSELDLVDQDLEHYGFSTEVFSDAQSTPQMDVYFTANNKNIDFKPHVNIAKYCNKILDFVTESDEQQESNNTNLYNCMPNGELEKDSCILRMISKTKWFVEAVRELINFCFSYFFDNFLMPFMSGTKSLFLSENKSWIDWFCVALGGFVIILFLFSSFLEIFKVYLFLKLDNEEQQYNGESFESPYKYDDTVSSVFSQFFDIKVMMNNKSMLTKCFISGNKILLPYHTLLVGDISFPAYRVVIFSDFNKDKRIIDHEKVDVIFTNEKDDVAILSLPSSFPTPFKNKSKWFKKEISGNHRSFLVNNEGVVAMTNINVRPAQNNVYTYFDWQNAFGSADVAYDFRGKGLCGSLIFHEQEGFSGMHVAGCAGKGEGIGKIWTSQTRQKIHEILSEVSPFIPFSVKDHKDDNSSVMRLTFREDQGEISKEEFLKLQASVPSASKLVTTPLYGVFPVTRFPAQLQLFGRCTVKDVAKKSFSPLKTVPEEEIQFAIKATNILIPEFGLITEKEIVNGNAMLAGLNKKSSNGFGCKALKEDYIDFDNGIFRDDFREEILSIENSLKNGTFPWKHFVWVESLKDELRGVEKLGVPRSFRVGTIHQQVLAKRYLGDMVQKLMLNRDFNGIMVGINPFVEWDKIAKKLAPLKVFAADVKLWDGGMLVQAQRAVAEVILSKFQGTNGERKALSFLLESLIHSLVLVQDDLFLTTHSLPSGHFLTAIFNSLVNRFYTAMWYFRVMSQNNRDVRVEQFLLDVIDLVYGDDKVVGVVKNFDILTAKTLKEFFESIGLGLTTSDKKTIDFDFQSLHEIDFLKRKFVFHPKLQRYMCPLDLRTLYSGLSFVDSDKDMNLVIQEKINNCQREFYLHENAEELLLDFYNKLDEINFSYLRLPIPYLHFLYSDENSVQNLYKYSF